MGCITIIVKIIEKRKSLELRRSGCSVKEIANDLGVSKGTISLWVKDVILSKKAKRSIENKMTAGQKASILTILTKTKNKEREATKFAKSVLSNFVTNNLFELILCAMIYECEGCKINKEVAFTNSDPNLIKIFIQLFRKSFDLDEKKFRVCVHLHEYHNINKQLNFWSKTLRIPIEQFSKPYLKKNSGINIKIGYQGCVRLRYYDVSIARKFRALSREFMNMGL